MASLRLWRGTKPRFLMEEWPRARPWVVGSRCTSSPSTANRQSLAVHLRGQVTTKTWKTEFSNTNLKKRLRAHFSPAPPPPPPGCSQGLQGVPGARHHHPGQQHLWISRPLALVPAEGRTFSLRARSSSANSCHCSLVPVCLCAPEPEVPDHVLQLGVEGPGLGGAQPAGGTGEGTTQKERQETSQDGRSVGADLHWKARCWWRSLTCLSSPPLHTASPQ